VHRTSGLAIRRTMLTCRRRRGPAVCVYGPTSLYSLWRMAMGIHATWHGHGNTCHMRSALSLANSFARCDSTLKWLECAPGLRSSSLLSAVSSLPYCSSSAAAPPAERRQRLALPPTWRQSPPISADLAPISANLRLLGANLRQSPHLAPISAYLEPISSMRLLLSRTALPPPPPPLPPPPKSANSLPKPPLILIDSSSRMRSGGRPAPGGPPPFSLL